jgi:hypothetical protein
MCERGSARATVLAQQRHGSSDAPAPTWVATAGAAGSAFGLALLGGTLPRATAPDGHSRHLGLNAMVEEDRGSLRHSVEPHLLQYS